MTHDPLCPYKPAALGTAGTGKYVAMVQGQPPVGCQCDLIYKVREGERMSEQTRWYSVNEEADFRVANARAAALRDAAEAVSSMVIGTVGNSAATVDQAVAAIEALAKPYDGQWERDLYGAGAVTWSQLRTFIAGSIAVLASACLGPLYNRLHRLSKETR